MRANKFTFYWYMMKTGTEYIVLCEIIKKLCRYACKTKLFKLITMQYYRILFLLNVFDK